MSNNFWSNNFWIQTYTGKKFDLENPTMDMICIEDIAHHLAIENRYGGATKFPYSVATHSLLVSTFAPDGLKLEALLHDAHEAYTKDLLTPMRRYLEDCEGSFESLVDDITALIEAKYNLSASDGACKIIKNIDLRMAKTERMHLMGDPPERWHSSVEDATPYNIDILERNWKNVEIQFLATFNHYKIN